MSQSNVSVNKDGSYRISVLVFDSSEGGSLLLVPGHPFFFNQRLANLVCGFSKWHISNFVIEAVPIVSSTDATPVAICINTNCTPVTQVQADAYAIIADAGISGMAWKGLTYRAQNVKQVLHPVAPLVPSDIDYIGYVAVTDQIALNTKIKVMAHFNLKLASPYTGQEYDNAFPTPVTITTGQNGSQSNKVISGPTFGFAHASTVTNVDLGELILTVGYAAATTDYADHTVFHNGHPLASSTSLLDRGTIHFLAKILN